MGKFQHSQFHREESGDLIKPKKALKPNGEADRVNDDVDHRSFFMKTRRRGLNQLRENNKKAWENAGEGTSFIKH